ncbi:MAG: hypothetical protein PVF09_13850 [Desulfobacterales bacterium]
MAEKNGGTAKRLAGKFSQIDRTPGCSFMQVDPVFSWHFKLDPAQDVVYKEKINNYISHHSRY